MRSRFYTQGLTARADYNFTPNVSWQNLQQYDNESRVLGFQSRFRWIPKPGNDMFVVINRGWVKTFDGSFDETFNQRLRNFSARFGFEIVYVGDVD